MDNLLFDDVEMLLWLQYTIEKSVDDNVLVTLNVDEDFNLKDSANNSTPMILIQLDDIVNTKNDIMLGNILHGDVYFNIIGIIDRANREVLEYKIEMRGIIQSILSGFISTGKRVNVSRISYNDVVPEDSPIKVSSFVMQVILPINKFDYSLTT